MNLTENEQQLFDALKSKPQITLDEIQKAFPDSKRSGMIVRIKYLAAKVAPHGWIIDLVSGRGRGNRAVYKIEKKF